MLTSPIPISASCFESVCVYQFVSRVPPANIAALRASCAGNHLTSGGGTLRSAASERHGICGTITCVTGTLPFIKKLRATWPSQKDG